jgi:hypothetical protein
VGLRESAEFPIGVNEVAAMFGAAAVRKQRHIGDFQKWKDHDAIKRRFSDYSVTWRQLSERRRKAQIEGWHQFTAK